MCHFMSFFRRSYLLSIFWGSVIRGIFFVLSDIVSVLRNAYICRLRRYITGYVNRRIVFYDTFYDRAQNFTSLRDSPSKETVYRP